MRASWQGGGKPGARLRMRSIREIIRAVRAARLGRLLGLLGQGCVLFWFEHFIK